eukprot:TRINITY_DN182_c0_g1_i2.p1 TRINITY_DN182_c0_g1~~TRINITY_DN182_c0_g1_i2.p1  ORF type:complete len:748 (+),score=163.20 TRINITY_DN182_c0_g1_i2:157-2244(+)
MSVPLKERHPNLGLAPPGPENVAVKENETKQLKLYKYSRGDDKVPVEFVRGAMLGKGAFAVCYEVTQTSTGQIYASKITAKAKLKNDNARRKLLLEVKLHKELRHEHIVAVHALYEDEENYYMLMEKCNGKTLRDIVRRKKRLEEPEAKVYMLQLLGAVEYLQQQNIVHRDMKLDNIFMHDNQVKLGDFGLAAKLQEGEKKQTMCGTPNYIAPEVLDRSGHGVEVDNWAVGVILYALLVGTPPFETKAVETTYEKIRRNDYNFPFETPISAEARDLISKILVPEPAKRLSISAIRGHRFFSVVPRFGGLSVLPLAMSSQKANVPGVQDVKQEQRESDLFGDEGAAAHHRAAKANVESELLEANSRKRKRGSDTEDMQLPEKRQATTANVAAVQQTTNNEARFNSQIIQSPSKRVREQYKQVSSRMANEPRMIKELHERLESFISQLKGDKASPSRRRSSRGSITPALRKHVWIVKWVDYSQKYGLGYQFCDGTIGVSFNDASKMVLNPDGTNVEFYRMSSNDQSSSATSTTQVPRDQKLYKDSISISGTLQEAVESCTDAFTKKRLALLNYFREYLNKSSKSPGLDAKPLMLDCGKDDDPSEQTSILHWIRTQDGIVFLMSDFSAQCNFYDHCKLVVDRNLESVTFVNTEGQRVAMNVAQALANPPQELLERIAYLSNCIKSFWMEKQQQDAQAV